MANRLAFLVLLGLALGAVAWWTSQKASAREAQAETLYPPTGQFIDVNGTSVHVVVKGSGPDLVLLHGASGNLRDFTFQMVDQLSDRYRVIAFDRPGMGHTVRVDAAYAAAWGSRAESPAEQVALLLATADRLGVTRPIVVGHSFGGAIALRWALDRPDDTAALVLLASVSNPWPGRLGYYYQLTGTKLGGLIAVPLIAAFTPVSRVTQGIASIFEPQAAPAGYIEHIGGALTLRRSKLRANGRQVLHLRPYIVEQSKHYGRLKMPVEILHGDADTIVPLTIHSEPLSKQIPHARLTVMQGVGHMPHHSQPDVALAAIDRAAEAAGLR